VGALKGPLHGGAPGPALDMVFEIGKPERAEQVIRAMLDRGERIMGFGHRVYRVRDPRADVLAAAAERFYSSDGDRSIYELARHVEATALRLLKERKPDRRLIFITSLSVKHARYLNDDVCNQNAIAKAGLSITAKRPRMLLYRCLHSISAALFDAILNKPLLFLFCVIPSALRRSKPSPRRVRSAKGAFPVLHCIAVGNP